MTHHRENTIKYIVPNLRDRWPAELKPYSDNKIAEVYEGFSLSDEYGDNDKRFPLWFGLLKG